MAEPLTEKYVPNRIDPECLSLCKEMNRFPGIKTYESCCGHGKTEFHVWFQADNLECLPPLLYWFASCHCGCYGWQVIAHTDCGMSPVTFFVEGPVGAYDESEKIAEYMRDYHETGEF